MAKINNQELEMEDVIEDLEVEENVNNSEEQDLGFGLGRKLVMGGLGLIFAGGVAGILKMGQTIKSIKQEMSIMKDDYNNHTDNVNTLNNRIVKLEKEIEKTTNSKIENCKNYVDSRLKTIPAVPVLPLNLKERLEKLEASISKINPNVPVPATKSNNRGGSRGGNRKQQPAATE